MTKIVCANAVRRQIHYFITFKKMQICLNTETAKKLSLSMPF